ncbi:dipeptidyl aminopeptidase [Bdellovibrio sp. HCB-162]|uniref:extracellular medium-chain-length polyhydroxyalkanoate depolymerase n=1 Tax=Bdellovibrio sp. HCB-162 TaxID=3394234 RepID=UPI0039BD8D3C
MKNWILRIAGVLIVTVNVQAKESMCTTTGMLDRITCPSKSVDIAGPHLTRAVKYSVPEGKTPRGGWPTVVIYQGSFFEVEFSRQRLMPFGGYNEIRLIQSLLDHGFAVIAPPAISGVAWMTNIIGVTYETSEDFYFVEELLKQMKAGTFGKLNIKRLYATGISSGGYHSSRMAVTFPGTFKALAVESASYANCKGPLCFVPEQIPENHPPTLFLHGELDTVVPVTTMLEYHERLKAAGIETEAFVDVTARHQWIDEAPELITNWFLAHP